ncbi:hypothetical protein EFK50_12900 [Nocardioides marmoriginsengisoli]|uniref:DUF3592 domain-containing protein n=1 Tax=Nocardioides marmoriginsengisoli TaxID=661483 RepID=A0A3N0CH85_9ACTN|nr:hypothetical protein [Nocardioides marmoriginsengisoli]RNL62649.1 hypothetical protein EFK50_12900 [Nocardioides marmoriginsengisoli]
MRSPRSFWAALTLLLVGVAFAALAAWSMVARSTIPLALDGTVTSIELRHEKHPGVDDVWMVGFDDDGPRHLDRAVAALLTEGDRVRKDAWSRTLVVDGETHDVALSDDARRMLVLAPVVGGAFAVLLVAGSRRP